MFDELDKINRRPDVFSEYTADALWTDDHRARQMLALHLNQGIDAASRSAGFIDASASWMTDRFQLGPGKSVCDFGCGPGLYTSRLAGSGAHVTGLDFSENSIRYARRQAESAGLPIRYIHTDYLEFRPEKRFDLVTLIMCDFCALSPVQRKRLLDIVGACLGEGGSLVLDVYSMIAFAGRAEARFCEKNQLDGFWFAGDYYCFVNTFKYDDEAVVLDKYSLFPESGPAETVYNWLQYFSPDGLADELAASGLSVAQIFDDVAGAGFTGRGAEFAVVATRAT